MTRAAWPDGAKAQSGLTPRGTTAPAFRRAYAGFGALASAATLPVPAEGAPCCVLWQGAGGASLTHGVNAPRAFASHPKGCTPKGAACIFPVIYRTGSHLACRARIGCPVTARPIARSRWRQRTRSRPRARLDTLSHARIVALLSDNWNSDYQGDQKWHRKAVHLRPLKTTVRPITRKKGTTTLYPGRLFCERG